MLLDIDHETYLAASAALRAAEKASGEYRYAHARRELKAAFIRECNRQVDLDLSCLLLPQAG